MDNQRLLIWATFALLAWMTYTAWMQDYGPKPVVAAPQATEQPATGAPLDADIATDLPEFGAAEESALTPPGAEPATPAIEAAGSSAPVVTVQTDVFKVEISTEGGTVQSAVLLKYPVAKDQPDTLVTLLSTDREQLGLIRTGILTDGDSVPDHNATFTAARTNYELGGQDELVVPLRWTDDQGVSVEKRFTFRRGSYAIDVQQSLNNASDSAVRAYGYAQMLRRSKEQKRSMFDVDSYSFDGVLVFNGEKSEKLKRDDLLDDGDGHRRYEQGVARSVLLDETQRFQRIEDQLGYHRATHPAHRQHAHDQAEGVVEGQAEDHPSAVLETAVVCRCVAVAQQIVVALQDTLGWARGSGRVHDHGGVAGLGSVLGQ